MFLALHSWPCIPGTRYTCFCCMCVAYIPVLNISCLVQRSLSGSFMASLGQIPGYFPADIWQFSGTFLPINWWSVNKKGLKFSISCVAALQYPQITLNGPKAGKKSP